MYHRADDKPPSVPTVVAYMRQPASMIQATCVEIEPCARAMAL